MNRIVVIAVGALIAACGASVTPTSVANDAAAEQDASEETAAENDATPPTGDAGSPPGDSGLPPSSCPAAPDSGVAPYETVANGTFVGPSTNSVICHATASLYRSPYTTPPNQLLLMLNSSDSPDDITFQSPPGAVDGLLTGMLSVSAAAAGTYGSATGGPCGGLVFSYDLPVPPSVDCEGGAPPSCPPGCTTVCSGFGCEPCSPAAPEDSYETYGTTDCLGDTQTTQGSWTATLTSVVPYSGPAVGASGAYYVVHGTFTANMTDGDAGADTAVLDLSF
jgi:hypothetical protein